ncbi:hypothetical protein T265_05483 [Opisthorchis viverrini]|uniref:Uncharacterized protein n=1 Tax=Opisthorchis viverrini TaxID=6198 RepID=A0A074ZNZ8_OPIVI|nr:hypothetical protein T265_05483 [Opisthorchis viverrini]KER27527.1 hypothetical protein T265_05483 [Opisthorchis viverrini]
MRRLGAARSVARGHYKREIQLGSRLNVPGCLLREPRVADEGERSEKKRLRGALVSLEASRAPGRSERRVRSWWEPVCESMQLKEGSTEVSGFRALEPWVIRVPTGLSLA